MIIHSGKEGWEVTFSSQARCDPEQNWDFVSKEKGEGG